MKLNFHVIIWEFVLMGWRIFSGVAGKLYHNLSTPSFFVFSIFARTRVALWRFEKKWREELSEVRMKLHSC